MTLLLTSTGIAMPTRSRTDLLALADRYARDRRAPSSVIVKELLHYEILYALVQSGAAEQLVFQGGTCLRLCYGGSRFSEDLDFAGGEQFAGDALGKFCEILEREISTAYGLRVAIKEKTGKLEGEGVRVDRWQARIEVPQSDPSIPQKQVINLEVATVPAHRAELVAVNVNYPHLSGPFRQILVAAESREEIFADKIVALGARKFLKYRDLWDLKMLHDLRIALDYDLVRAKLTDYGLDASAFEASLRTRAQSLADPDHLRGFQAEMSRFVDANQAGMLRNPALCRPYMDRCTQLASAAADALAQKPAKSSAGPQLS